MTTDLTKLCVHFDPPITKKEKCKLGIKYKDVSFDGRLINIPCHRGGSDCLKYKCPSTEQIKEELDELNKIEKYHKIVMDQIRSGSKNIICPCCKEKVEFYNSQEERCTYAKCINPVCGLFIHENF